MEYIECHFSVQPAEPWSEILLAHLQDFPFESFEFTGEGLKGFMPKVDFVAEQLEDFPLKNHPEVQVQLTIKEHPKHNWNETWEQNFEPIVVGDQCLVRAEFHPAKDFPYELIITPKMSFGTGHHQTTQMMIQLMLAQQQFPPVVLDMGCGTGVLAILASKMGAGQVMGVDIDAWCIENSVENAARNSCSDLHFIQGDIGQVRGQFDWILANINRNVLHADLPKLKTHLNSNGKIFISGFLQSDWNAMQSWLKDYGFIIKGYETKDAWMAAILECA